MECRAIDSLGIIRGDYRIRGDGALIAGHVGLQLIHGHLYTHAFAKVSLFLRLPPPLSPRHAYMQYRQDRRSRLYNRNLLYYIHQFL